LPSIGFAFRAYDQGGDGRRCGTTDKVRNNGFRQITSSSSRQLNSVEDLRGFKICVAVTVLLTSFSSERCPQASATAAR
jgi:TRAP-type transport system periplasmic protein